LKGLFFCEKRTFSSYQLLLDDHGLDVHPVAPNVGRVGDDDCPRSHDEVHGLVDDDPDHNYDFGEGDLHGHDDVDYDEPGLDVYPVAPNVGRVGHDDCPWPHYVVHGLVDDDPDHHYDFGEGDLHGLDDVDYDKPGLDAYADDDCLHCLHVGGGHDVCPHDVVHGLVDDHVHHDLDEAAQSAELSGHDDLLDAAYDFWPDWIAVLGDDVLDFSG
jgi:hypothetical protein